MVGISREEFEHAAHSDPHRPDAGFPAALPRLNRNSVKPMHHRHLLQFSTVPPLCVFSSVECKTVTYHDGGTNGFPVARVLALKPAVQSPARRILRRPKNLVTALRNILTAHIPQHLAIQRYPEVTTPSVILKLGGGQKNVPTETSSSNRERAEVPRCNHRGRPRPFESEFHTSLALAARSIFIVPEERPEFDIYYNDLIAALAPEGAAESLLAEAIILDAWRLTRARLVEKIRFSLAGICPPSRRLAAGAETWLAHSKELSTLTLYEQRIYRVLTHNKAEFASIQSARAVAQASPACALPATQIQVPEAPPLPAQPAEPKPETAAPEQPVGFVHSSDLPAPPPVHPLNPKSKPPRSPSPLGSFIRAMYHPRRLTPNP